MSASLVDRARAAATAAHAGQVDKQGRDYVEAHLAPVAAALAGQPPEVVAAGWLHDIVEDTDWTVDEVAAEFGADVARAVDAVTRREGETYEQLIGWSKAEGVELGEGMWESYLSDPGAEPDPSTWRTQIVWPLA